MAAASVFAFWVVALLLIVVPGPDWAFTLGAGRSVVPAVGGLVIGYTAMTAVVAAGLGAWVVGSAVAMGALTVAGGLYLIWLGVSTVVRPGRIAEVAPRKGRPVLVRGIGVSGLNPKGLLLFLALLPQFADPAQPWPMAVQLGVLGLVFTATCAAFYLALGTVTRTVFGTRPGAARVVSRVSGGAMVVVGAALLVERLTGG